MFSALNILKLGSFQLDSEMELVKLVNSKIIHPNYTEIELDIEEFNVFQVKVQFDVALLEMETSFQYFTSSIQPVDLGNLDLVNVDLESVNLENKENRHIFGKLLL